MSYLAGISNAYAGFQKGADQELARMELARERARKEKQDAQADEEYQFKKDERSAEKAKKTAIADAYKPREVTTSTELDLGDGKAVAYDMPEGADLAGSDYRQARNMAQSTGLTSAASAPKTTYAANGIELKDAAEAKAINSPEAGNQRAAQAMRGLGDYQGAMQLEAASKQAQVADMALADKAWSRKMGQAIANGHSGIADVISGSEYGPLAGKKLIAVESPDKSTVTYNLVNPDGSLTPSPLTFPNTQEGVMQAAGQLDSGITAEHRYADWKDEKKAAQAQKNFERTADRADIDTASKAELRISQAEAASLRASIAGQRGIGGVGAASTEPQFNPMGNFDAKKAQAVAMDQASKMAESAAAEGKPMPPAQQAALAQQLYRTQEDAFTSENTRRHVAQVASTALREASNDPVQYAAAYGKAVGLGMTAPSLAAMGFKPPSTKEPAQKAANTPPAAVAKPAPKADAETIAAQNGTATPKPTAKNDYAMQMAEAKKTRLAKRAQEVADQAAQEAQDKAVEAKRKAFLATRGSDKTRTSLLDTPINFSQR